MDYAVKFEDVHKEYPFYQHITAGFKSFLFNLPRNIASFKKSKFVALKEISFEVKKGETFGIIGRNGSGKSTILGLVAGVMKPDRGVVRTDGRISSLLELGAGFHPDLSGIENIVMNGILMGNTKQEMLAKADEIIEFSELGDFIYQPLRTYSSGMQMRLGFSVAVHIDPEILLIDEALSVGDISFQEKCEEKMLQFKKSGATILLVSHNMTAIAKVCDRAAWIESGNIREIGEPISVISEYLKHLDRPMTVDIEEGQPMCEAVIETEPDDTVIIQHPYDLSEPAGIDAPEDTAEIPQPSLVMTSWWDSPIILRQCENLITGDADISLYEFLRKEYSIANLQKGLSICTKLKGIEGNFIKYNICNSFEVLNDPHDIRQGTREWKRNFYDLFLYVDLLNSIEDLDGFLKDAASSLKDKGFIIAMEYVGPAFFRCSDQELEIADMIYKALDGRNLHDKERFLKIFQAPQSDGGDIKSAVSSDKVITSMARFFDILSIRYFAGPLHDLILNKILAGFDQANEKDSALIKTIIQCERVLVRKGILQDKYAMIIARKRLK